jgi:hypothetical protein
MRFTVSLNEGDYLQAQQALIRERKAVYLCTQIGWAVLFLLGCIPAAMSYLTDGTIDPVALLFGAPAWLFAAFLLFYRKVVLPRRISAGFRGNRTLHGEQPWEIDEHSLKTSGDWGHTELLWKAVARWSETPTHFLFFLGQGVFYVIPKRSFSPELEAEFRTLLRTQVQ